MSEIKYKLVSTSSKGRSLVAKAEIKLDEVVLEESPLVSAQFSWNKAYGYLACEHCMAPLESAEDNIRRLAKQPIILPYPEMDAARDVLQRVTQCPDCQVKFCSVECLDQANKVYHKIMCASSRPFNQINEIWKKMHYPPESASVLLVLRIFAMIKNNPKYLADFNEFCQNSVNEDLSIAHKILGEKFTSQLSHLHQAFVQVFSNDEILSNFLTIEGLTQIFALIGTNAQGIGSSSFAIWVKNVSELETIDDKQRTEVDDLIDTFYATLEETVGQFLNNEGSGLYSKQSKINHSCSPNAEVRFPFSNFVLQVVATRNIKPDEEICISYLDECQLDRSRHSRQKFLQENYVFLCECQKCNDEIEQPDVTSDEDNEEMDTDEDD